MHVFPHIESVRFADLIWHIYSNSVSEWLQRNDYICLFSSFPSHKPRDPRAPSF